MPRWIYATMGAAVAAGGAIAGQDAGGDALELVRDGRSAYRIVVRADASPSERRGARELRDHLERMTGATLEIVTDAAALPPRALLVGYTRFTESAAGPIDRAALGPEGYTLRTRGPHVIIAGAEQRGAMYGCYAFLEALGVRWYTSRVTRVPERRHLTVPPLDRTSLPAYEYREPFFTEAQERDWAARNRVNGFHADLDAETGGRLAYHPFVHSFDALVPPELFAEHPEYFPLREGRRRDGYVQRCLTHPDVLRLTIETVREWIRTVPEAAIYSVSQNDTGNWCECDPCRARTEQYGGHSGLYLWFVNQVAEAIGRDHPDKLIDTLAYQFTEPPPTGIVPRSNVRIRLCPIANCVGHPFEQCRAEPNRRFLEHLRGWSSITDTLYIWHYNTNFANYLQPLPNFLEFPEEARFYRRSGVRGIFFQGAYAPGGGGFNAELQSWVMARLLWDPDQDADALVTEWMRGVYGPAWEPMRRWFDLLHEPVRNPDRHVFIYDPPTAAYLTPELLEAGARCFEEAARLAAEDPVAAEYVDRARLGLRYTLLARDPKEGPELRAFLADVRRYGITQLREGRSLEEWEREYLARARQSAKDN